MAFPADDLAALEAMFPALAEILDRWIPIRSIRKMDHNIVLIFIYFHLWLGQWPRDIAALRVRILT